MSSGYTRKGIACPNCGAMETRVLWTRKEPDRIRRRRECKICHKRVTTTEISVGVLNVEKVQQG